MDIENFNQLIPEHFSPLATVPPLPTHILDPYIEGAIFKSFKAVQDAILQYTVIRDLSYKV